MKKIILLIFILVLTGCSGLTDKDEPKTEDEPKNQIEEKAESIPRETGVIGKDLPVSRALAAKMIALTFSEGSINAAEDNVYADIKESDWFYSYVCYATQKGYMKAEGNFYPLEPLTLKDAESIVLNINPENSITVKNSEESEDKPISYQLWCELFIKTLESLSGSSDIYEKYGVENNTAVIFSTGGQSDLDTLTAATTKGKFEFSGYSMDAYIDTMLSFYSKDGEILILSEVLDNEPEIKNVYISSFKNNSIEVFYGGVTRDFKYYGSYRNEKEISDIFDIKVKNGEITDIKSDFEIAKGVVKKCGDTNIELENKESIEFENNVQVYNALLGISSLSLNNIMPGNEYKLYIKDGKTCAIEAENEIIPQNIRIILSNTGFLGYEHNKVEITSDSDYYVSENGNSVIKKAGESLILNLDYQYSGRIYITPLDSEATLELKSVEKGNGMTPKYFGTIEVEKTNTGYILVNEVDIERYLCGVIPSEMPASYGLEAAKVQAIAARSYAYNQYYLNKYRKFGANVDDSVMCQVYNNTALSEVSSKGVEETEGLCITYGNTVINANFYSTSSGIGANSGEVWANSQTGEFPSLTKDYLKSVKQFNGNIRYDLKTEEGVEEFFKNKDIDAYDKASGWFRWQLEMPYEELNETISRNLPRMYENHPYLIEGSINIGNIKDISVLERGEAGNIMRLKLSGDKGSVILNTEYVIRSVLVPKQYVEGKPPIKIFCHNGIVMENYSIFPSAFFVMDKEISENGDLKSITFYGGGNGHGVGLSQNGAKGMIEQGYKFDEILGHYFPGTKVEDVFK
ncbi:MAG: SpoIID/LytB domain-containing protein [Lachnospiraceae bacterium]|nr:SpoIID/LytB domain-containing protein [Lachnospiraceae bacterium]